jgi:hypothetical protein
MRQREVPVAHDPAGSAPRLDHPPLFQRYPARLAVHAAPIDMRATAAELAAFRRFASAGDPLADAVVAEMRTLPAGVGRRHFEQALAGGLAAVADAGPALRAFFAEVEVVPAWVDRDRLALGARTVQRTGLAGAHGALVDVALMGGYLSFRPPKVLVRTGEIDAMAPRRITETAVWWHEVTDDGGLERAAPGFRDTLRVRLAHAHVRAAMNGRADWDHAAWDAPVNQPQLVGTLLLFSLVSLLALRAMGFRFAEREVDAVLHLWRYVGHLLGVHPDLLPACEADAWRLFWLMAATEIGPDDDSRRLAVALSRALPALHGVRGDGPGARLASWAIVGYHSTLSRLVFGDHNGDALGLPRRPAFIAVVIAASVLTFGAETARRWIPGATGLAVRIGQASRRRMLALLVRHQAPDLSYAREPRARRAA